MQIKQKGNLGGDALAPTESPDHRSNSPKQPWRGVDRHHGQRL